MKKLLSIALVVTMLFACVATAVSVSAETSGDYYYSVNDYGITATITKYKGTQADVVIPSVIDGYTITSIGYEAFSGCTSLASVTIPEGVTSIGWSAFYNCTSLASVTIPNSVTSIGRTAFSDCTSLTSLTIPVGVSSISDGAFYNCSGLTSITIPEGVTSIGGSAFYNCSSLTSVTIPSSVNSIDYSAFSGCSSLTDFYVDTNNPYYSSEDGVLFNNDKTVLVQYPIGNTRITYVIPKGVTSIGNSAFSGCTSLASVTIPKSLTSIGSYAFSRCTSLTSLTIPEGVTSIGWSAFYGCTSLEGVYITNLSAWCNIYFDSNDSNPLYYAKKLYLNGELATDIVIPESVTSIERSAFSSCTSLASVTIPDSVTSIGDWAFSGCTNLESVTIPESVTSIGSYVFFSCTSLESVTIPEGVTSIGVRAFSDCTSLASVTIPESVTSIESYVFSRCTSLTSVTIPASVTSIELFAFEGCDNLVIYGYSGTAAETYALDNGFDFIIKITDLVNSESNVAVSGSVPEETQLIVNKITATDTRVTYDITLTNNGEEIQPESVVTVKIPVPAGMDGADCRVYREEESGSYTDMNAVYKDGFMVFTTEHFSKYVITSEMLGVVLGDINGDGVVTLKDVLISRKYVAGVSALTEEELARGDLNGDGVVTLKDVLIMRKMVAGVL